MSTLNAFIDAPPRSERLVLANAPEGHDAFVLGGLVARAGRTLIHVGRDDGRMARMRAALGFFYPEIEVRTFPAWDCLPYDRVSPNPEIVSRRIATLAELAHGDGKPRIVLTTVNAAIQRVPPRKLFAERTLILERGSDMPLDRLKAFLERNGYNRAETVREAGEYAVRGGLIDLYPSGAPAPLRLDFFGDRLEAIRSFDPLSQRSAGALERADLKPMSEVLLDQRVIERFRSRYRQEFGTGVQDDPLYGSVSAGRRHAGMEHFLPLFYESLDTLFDYLPGTDIVLDHQAEEVRGERIVAIADFYNARETAPVTRGVLGAAPVYRPLRPELLYLGDKDWSEALANRRVAQLSPFGAPESVTLFNAGARPGLDFSAARADPNVNLFDVVRQQLDAEAAAGRRALIVAYSTGSAERLKTVMKDHGIAEPVFVEFWQGFIDLPKGHVGLAVLPLERGYVAGDATLVTEQDILGDRLARPARRRTNLDQFVAEIATLTLGDLVVHADHGIGRYDGLVTLE
ncbi:MAG: CarD family transcriptional regulator, partial [Stellaceae bacterium]